MTPDKPDPARGDAAGSGEDVCFAGKQSPRPSNPNTQAKYRNPRAVPGVIAEMRAEALRACLTREISRAMAIALQAQAALFDGDDDAALACLFRHWFLLRDDIRPLLVELRDVHKQGGAP